MNPSSKNSLAFQNELINTVNNPVVNEGRPIIPSVAYPAVDNSMKTVPVGKDKFNIVNAAGEVVGSISANIFGLGEGVVGVVRDVGKGVVNITGDVLNTGVKTVAKVVTTGTGLVKSGVNIVGDTADAIVNGISNAATSAVDTIRQTILNTNDTEEPNYLGSNPLGNIVVTNAASRSSLKVATDNLVAALSVPNPDPVTLRVSAQLLQSNVENEVKNSTTPNDVVKQSSLKVQQVLQNPSASPEAIKEATVSLQQSLGSNPLGNIAVTNAASNTLGSNPLGNIAVTVPASNTLGSNPLGNIAVTRTSLREATNNLVAALSVPKPDPANVRVSAALLKSHVESEVKSGTTPNDAIKQSSQIVQQVLQNPSASPEAIKEATISLQKSLGIIPINPENATQSESLLSNITSSINAVGNAIFNTGKSVTGHTVDGVGNTVKSAVNTVTNVGTDIVQGITGKLSSSSSSSRSTLSEEGDAIIGAIKNEGDMIVGAIKNEGNAIVGAMKTIKDEIVSTKPVQTGGVSILNIADSSDVNTRMLLPNNFLGSKHVYFVRYHPNGTNVYDYKLGMKGGSVDRLYLKNVSSIWNNNKSCGTISNNTISNGIKVVNNILNKLSSSAQVGGYVRERTADKDAYYDEYKNYKLKYLALKN